MKPREGNWRSVSSAAMRGVSAIWSLAPVGLRRTGWVARRETLIPVVILAWLWLGVSARFSAAGAPAEPAAASAPASFSVDLNYQEGEEELVSRSVDLKLRTGPFQKEPALPGQRVFRGSPDSDVPLALDQGRPLGGNVA